MLRSTKRSVASAFAQSPRYSRPARISDGYRLAQLAFVDAVHMNGSCFCSSSKLRRPSSQVGIARRQYAQQCTHRITRPGAAHYAASRLRKRADLYVKVVRRPCCRSQLRVPCVGWIKTMLGAHPAL